MQPTMPAHGGCLAAPWLKTSALLCWSGPHLTAAPIATRVAVTLAEFQLTVHTSVAWATGAGVAPLPTVGACRPVLAWGVVGTVVEICETESNQLSEAWEHSTSRLQPLGHPMFGSKRLQLSLPDPNSLPPLPMKSQMVKHLEACITIKVNQA